MIELTKYELMSIRDEVIEAGVDEPAQTCCRNWKHIDELILAVLHSDTFNQIYVRRDSYA